MGIKRDKKKKTKKKLQNKLNNNKPKELTKKQIEKGAKELFNPLKLTTPKKIDNNIREFCKKISNFEPFFIKIEPESWSRQSCCDLNVKEYIKKNRGQIICGYKIWYNEPKYIEAERHAIWYKDGQYKDITFNSDGEEKILFLPDILEKQNTLEQNKNKIRWGKDSKTKRLIKAYEEIEKKIPMQQMSNEEAWNTMLTYEDWKRGERMSNFQFANKS